MIDPRHLSLIRELQHRGSVAAVATATHRTPSAVSQQLRTAERDLGVRLVEPDGRGIRLTDAGRRVAELALDVEVALERVATELVDFTQRTAGTVRLAALPSAAEYLVPAVLTALRDTDIQLHLDDVDVSEERFAELSNDYDLVLGHSMRDAPERSASLLTRSLVPEPLDLAVPDTAAWAGRRTVRAAEAVQHPWIVPPPGFPFRALLSLIEQRAGREAHIVGEVRDNRVVEAMIRAGHGVALLPRFTTRAQSGVRTLALTDVPAVRHVVLTARRDRAERAAVRHVTDLFVRVAEQHGR
ncbi:LysR family transcriptional regulator [Calidifontibacter terrae]